MQRARGALLGLILGGLTMGGAAWAQPTASMADFPIMADPAGLPDRLHVIFDHFELAQVPRQDAMKTYLQGGLPALMDLATEYEALWAGTASGGAGGGGASGMAASVKPLIADPDFAGPMDAALPAGLAATDRQPGDRVFYGVVDPSALLSQPLTNAATPLLVTVGSGGGVHVTLDVLIRTQKDADRMGCMKGSGRVDGLRLSGGAFQATIPMMLGFRDVPLGNEDPCSTMSQESVPLAISFGITEGTGVASATLGWIAGPVEVQLREF